MENFLLFLEILKRIIISVFCGFVVTGLIGVGVYIDSGTGSWEGIKQAMPVGVFLISIVVFTDFFEWN